MGIKVTLLQILVGCSNHCATKKSRDEQVICGSHNYRIAQVTLCEMSTRNNCIMPSRKYSLRNK